MNKDDFDIFRHLRPNRNNSALDLLLGIETREYGHSKNKPKAKENVEFFAEEQLVRKETLKEMRCEMPGLPRSTFLMVFSPDGQRAASTHGNHNIYVTDLRSGKNIKTLVGHPRTPWCIAFHPTCNQIVASGCLGGQVRIWDLSGGSEVWNSATQSVIASLAFHPNDRILVIATFNEVHFWDWSKPEPFVHCATNNPKEKVRYVAFDKLGHKLITGIANGPQTRWERVRAPVPVPRQERCASPYRRRITQRLVSSVNPPGTQPIPTEVVPELPPRESSSNVPERERRIMFSYRNLVREYGQLVHRYLQLYRPPTMIDRGTDPMEPNQLANSLNSSGTQTAEGSTSATIDPAVPGPSGVKRSISVESSANDALPGPSGSSVGANSSGRINQGASSSKSNMQAGDFGVSNNSSGEPEGDGCRDIIGSTPDGNRITISCSSCQKPVQHPEQDTSTQTSSPAGDSSSSLTTQQDSPLPAPRTNRATVIISTGNSSGSVSSGQQTGSSPPRVSVTVTRVANCSPSRNTPGSSASGRGESSWRSYRSRLSTSTINLPSPSSTSPSRIFRVVKRPETLIRGTQTSESRKHKAEGGDAGSLNEKRMRTTSSGESCSTSATTGEEAKEIIEHNHSNDNVAPEDGSSTSEVSPIVDEEASIVSLEGPPDEQRSSSVALCSDPPENSNQRNSPIPEDNFSSFGTNLYPPPESPFNLPLNLTTRNTDSDPETRDGDNGENIRQPSSRYSQRFLEYIRANQQRVRELRRLIENDSRQDSREDTTTTDNSLSSNIDSSEINQPGTSGLNNSEPGPSNTNQRNVDELLSNIRRTAEVEVRNRMLPIIRSVPVQDRQELLRLFENGREHVKQRFRQMYPVFLKRQNKRRLPVQSDSSSDSSSSEAEQDNPTTSNASRPRRRNRDNQENVETSTTSDVATTNTATTTSPVIISPRVSSPSTTAPSQTGRIRVRNFNTELEQLVTSLLTEIERSETTSSNRENRTDIYSENNGESDRVNNEELRRAEADGANTQTTEAHGSVLSSARTRPSGLQSPMPPFMRSYLYNQHSESPQNLSSRPTPRDPISRSDSPPFSSNLRDSISDPLLGDPLFSENSPLFSPPPPGPNSQPSNLYVVPLSTYLNLQTRPTNSPTYTHSSSVYQSRRRLFSHRMSAFMPTRVNYTRNNSRLRRHQYPVGSGRSGPRRNPTFALDELINYAERENSEEDPLFTEEDFPPLNPENFGIGSAYSNIVHDLESSLNDVRNIRASNRPGETSNMLSSFSERLENIMNQSDTILRNLRSSMEMLPPNPELPSRTVPENESWNFNDAGFYVRVRNEETSNDLSDTIAADHTYHNPNSTQSGGGESMSPLMTSLHLTISHIQRQARLLRRQVESIERIDRAMVEVAQLQLMRQLVIELVRHIRSMSGESRSTGMTSVRQMMAGTRISDSSPYDSPSEEASSNQPLNLATNNGDIPPPARPSSSRSDPTNLPGPSSSSSGTSSSNNPRPPRSTSRKTYPPSRFVRFARTYQRRPHLMHWFSRRCLNRLERGARGSSNSRPTSSRVPPSNSSANPQIFNYSNINSSTLGLMTRRLENLLTDQMRVFTRPQESPPQARSNASVDLGEHILALRLHGCLLRMNRVLGNSMESSSLRNLRSESTAAVTQDGASRYGARHTLSLIVDGMSRHIEEIRSNTIPQNMRMQIHGVLAMSLLLTELLVLQVVDSIPPPTGMNLEPERESLTTRIDQMCTQMLQSRFSGSSQQLTRSLRLMRLTMRHAHRALDQTYNARRSAMMLPRRDTDRRQLLGSINRCLRTIQRRESPRRNVAVPRVPLPIIITARNENENSSNNSDTATPSTSTARTAPPPNENTEAWYNTINDLITRYSGNGNREEEQNDQPSTSAGRNQSREAASSNNDNSDGDDDEPYWLWYRGSGGNGSSSNNNTSSSSYNSNLYRSNNVNLANSHSPENQQHQPPPRLWNVPSVQVNDVPVTEPFSFSQMVRQRVSELRANPRMGLFRPRFLHPLYASVNPFDADLDDSQRDQIYDSDMITTVTPNHRIQAWDISNWSIPSISNSLKNVVVSECKIHNDASVDIAKDGTLLVTLLPSGGYLNVTNRLGVYSLRWETLGQCLYTTSFEQNAVSVSLSPLSRHLVVGFASRRVSLVLSDRWVMARIYKIEQKDVPGDRLPILRELEQSRESRINCIRWLPTSGQGLIYATNTGQLVVLS